uniref:Signal recognition particle subunit SRP72 n=1 Tax=Steinernema glaseri TaxID=37863 RepID=A0A1I8AWK8_9BILA
MVDSGSCDVVEPKRIVDPVLLLYKVRVAVAMCWFSAFHMKRKLVGLIKNGDFKEAEALITKTPEKTLGDVSFEKAYICYRTNRDEEALKALGESTEQRCLELKAQVYYRMGRFDTAYDLLLAVIKNSDDDYEAERQANLLAIAARMQNVGGAKDPNVTCTTYEQYYNKACYLIEEQKYTEALEILGIAEDTCRKFFANDGLSDDEIEEEIAIITDQKRHVLSVIGQQSAENQPSIDVDELEEMIFVPKTSKPKKEDKKDVADTEIVTGKLRARKRKRKVILPKNMDPSVKPDPERWLPRQERTAYKRWLKKHKDHDVGRGTQGATSPGGDAVESSPAQHTPTIQPEGPRQQRPNAQQAKKKSKKKGKW